MSLILYTHDDCLAHNPGPGHPESPQRLRSVLDHLAATGFGGAEARWEQAPLGADAQVLLAHTAEHLQHIRDTAPSGGRAALDGDTMMSVGSLEAALRAVGAACEGVDRLLAQDCRSVFCATRPPGHHATPDQAMGFCLFNHAAIAALHARQVRGLGKVAVVDFDVHHGNGSQDILTGKSGILYISTHQSPLYPGTGSSKENIPGNILNLPLPQGTDGSRYRDLFESSVITVLQDFQPDLLVVSAGFDAHYQDPLASLALDEEDYHWIGAALADFAANNGDIGLLSVLEGGYNLDALGPSVTAYLRGILGKP